MMFYSTAQPKTNSANRSHNSGQELWLWNAARAYVYRSALLNPFTAPVDGDSVIRQRKRR